MTKVKLRLFWYFCSIIQIVKRWTAYQVTGTFIYKHIFNVNLMQISDDYFAVGHLNFKTAQESISLPWR